MRNAKFFAREEATYMRRILNANDTAWRGVTSEKDERNRVKDEKGREREIGRRCKEVIKRKIKHREKGG